MQDARSSKIQAVDRAVAILRCFKEKPKLGITELSRLMDLPTSTVFGIVNTLAADGMLSRDPASNKYELGIEVYLLSLYSNRNLRTIVLPYLRRLVDEFGETANLVVHDGTHAIYVEKMESPHAMRICTVTGQRLPFYCCAVGRAILAFLPEEGIRAALDSYDYRPYTDNTPRDAAAVRRQLEQIRTQGYCMDDEEFEPGIVCFGAPILSPQGTPVAGISVSGPATRLQREAQTEIVERLREYARDIAAALGGK